jgi:peptidoglycan/xylan/chitin deacetylase (PgdA/CDA1 family)
VSLDEVTREVETSKDHLEQVVGRAVTSFCYPRGSYDAPIAKAVERAGYSYARTVRRFDLGPARIRFEAGTSLETHRNPIPTLPRDLMSIAALCRYRPDRTLALLDWERLALHMFDRVRREGGVFHLWGHSWVVEHDDGWAKLQRVLRHIAGHDDVRYVVNGDVQDAATSPADRP